MRVAVDSAVVPTLLLITAPAEEGILAAALRGEIFLDIRLRLLSDLADDLSPAQHVALERPDVVVLGTGLLGVDVAAYVEAARTEPGCLVFLLCDRAFADAARQLRPDQVLLRPVTGADLLSGLRPVLPSAFALGTPRPASSFDLLRADDLLPGPLSLFDEGEAPRRDDRSSGQFETVAPAAPPPPVDFALPQASRPKVTPVMVDPQLYDDAPPARKSPQVTSASEPLKRPNASGPPPIPDDATPSQRHRRVSLPPPLPRTLSAEKTAKGDSPPPAQATEGDLQTTQTPVLFGRLCTSGYSGCLLLVREGSDLAQRALFFDVGRLVAASSTLPTDSFPELLYQEGRLSKEQLKRARNTLSRLPQPGSEGPGGGETNFFMAERLVMDQLLPRAEISALLRRHTIEIFYRSLAWEQGSFRLLSRKPPEDDVVSLKEAPGLLLLEGIRRKVSLEVLLSRIGPEITVLRPAGMGPLLLKDAGITAVEERALPLFDGKHTLAQVIQKSGLAEHAAYVLAYALLCLSALNRPTRAPAEKAPPRDTGPRRVVPPPPPSPSSVLGPGPPPLPATGSASLLAAEAATALILAKYQHVLEADYFTFLDVPRTASMPAIQQAHDALREKLSDKSVPAACRERFRAELEQIAVVLGETRDILFDEELLVAYRTHLTNPPQDPQNHQEPG